MSKSSKIIVGLAGVALGYFLARKISKEREMGIKKYFFGKGSDIASEAKELISGNEEVLERFMKKVDLISLELDEKIDLLKKIVEEKKCKSDS